MRSSHYEPDRHNSCRILLPSNRTGATKSVGSKVELTVASIPLLSKNYPSILF